MKSSLSPWIQHPTVLRGQTVELRLLEKEHLEELYRAAADPLLWEHVPVEGYKRDRFMEVYDRAIEDRNEGRQYPFVISYLSTGRLIGSTRLFEIYPADKKLEIGWTWIVQEFWRTRVNTECKYLLLEYCLEALGARRVQLKTDEKNERSRKAILGIGGQFEGILRKDRIRDNGTSRSAAYYSILDDEWPGVKTRLLKKLSE